MMRKVEIENLKYGKIWRMRSKKDVVNPAAVNVGGAFIAARKPQTIMRLWGRG